MGKSMARHLMEKGHTLMVYNRTATKADDLVKAGAHFRPPHEIAKQADCVFLMLGYPHDVRQMVLDQTEGILKHMRPGSTLVDHTTSSPGLAEQISQAATSFGVYSVDAPVSGGDIGARNGKLVTMVGGSSEAVGSVKPLMEAYSVEVKHMADAGAG